MVKIFEPSIDPRSICKFYPFPVVIVVKSAIFIPFWSKLAAALALEPVLSSIMIGATPDSIEVVSKVVVVVVVAEPEPMEVN